MFTYSADYYPQITLESCFTNLDPNTTEPLPTTTCTLQTTYSQQQLDRQTIDKPTNFTNNRPTDF